MGDFLIEKPPEDCKKQVETKLGEMGFTAARSSGSTTVFHEIAHGEEPSLWKTALGVASNVLLSSSSGRGEEGNPRSVEVVVLGEGAGTRLVLETADSGLQQDLDEWAEKELGGSPQN